MEKFLDIIPDYIAYTDGSCNNFSMFGEGGASYVLLNGTKDRVLETWSKGLLGTTNNRAELVGILSALQRVPNNSTILIRTDSQYCIMVLDKKSQKLPKANKDLVRQCFDAINCLKAVYFEWVKGHNGEEFNEMADKLAEARTEEIRDKFRIPVYDYKDYSRPFTEEEKARLNRFNDWIYNNSDAIEYRDCVPFWQNIQPI